MVSYYFRLYQFCASETIFYKCKQLTHERGRPLMVSYYFRLYQLFASETVLYKCKQLTHERG